MNSKFTNINNSAPVVDLLERNKKVVPRSKFNFSNTKILNGNFGTIIPIDLIHTLPNEDYNIGYDILSLTRVPAVRRILSGCRMYVHTVFQPESNLWEGALNQKTGGRSGNIDLKKPTLIYKVDSTYNGIPYDCRTPNSLCDLLGLPVVFYDSSSPLLSYVPVMSNDDSIHKINEDYDIEVDALPFFMYQRLCRDMFFNSNLLYNNKNWYPDNEYHFILPYDCEKLNLFNYNYNSEDYSTYLYNLGSPNSQSYFANGNLFVPNNSYSPVFLPALHYRQFRGDVFTSSLPFPDLIRGDAPVLDMNSISSLDDSNIPLNIVRSDTWNNSIPLNSSLADSSDVALSDFYFGRQQFPPIPGSHRFLSSVLTSYDESTNIQLVKDYFSVSSKKIAEKLIGSYVSLSDLRSLLVYTLIKQKNALTGGDYNDLVKAHFGVSPKMRNFQHTYIGGFYADFVFNEVFQTSESETTPLGTTASRGVTAQSGYVGKFHSDDYGYIMTVLEIVPETFYHQGISKNLTKLTREDVYLPESNELSPQAILNQEIFASSDKSYNEDVFGYTERNIEYKFRNNEVHGLASCGSASEYDNALLQKRTFSSKVYLNNDFVTLSPKNIDMSIMSSIDEPPFDIVVKSRIEKVSPIPYVSIPGGLDLSLV